MQSIKDIISQNQKHNDILTKEMLERLNPEEEYVKDNDIFCKKCGGRRTRFGFTKKIWIKCSCQMEQWEKENQASKNLERKRYLEQLRRDSLLGDEYKNATFDKTDVYSDNFAAIYARCEKFCANCEKVLEKGHGIYLFGDKGTGKTHLTACIANELLNKGRPVIYTSMGEISKTIRSNFGSKSMSEAQFMQRLRDVDFLIIDDFGTERVTKNDDDLWLQEKVFEVVNSRYNNRKPMIFTSNYSLQEMVKERGLSGKTADRIREKCVGMELRGKSYRLKKRDKTDFDF